jgi:hypothetical protein
MLLLARRALCWPRKRAMAIVPAAVGEIKVAIAAGRLFQLPVSRAV